MMALWCECRQADSEPMLIPTGSAEGSPFAEPHVRMTRQVAAALPARSYNFTLKARTSRLSQSSVDIPVALLSVGMEIPAAGTQTFLH